MGSLLPVALLAGCNDFLTGTGLTTNPNSPTKAGTSQLFVGVTVTQTVLQTGDLARLYSMWMQSMAGTDRQYIPLANYVFDEDAFSGDWSSAYTGGGLIDERTIQQQALAAGDTTYAGIAKVMEALTMGTVADVWGDVPYSQAVSSVLEPALDPQQTVFQEVQAQLDTAIAYIPCASPSCAGPGPNDLFYGGDKTKWLALAHTLKARYFMHVTPNDPTGYASALAEAQQGIADTSGDMKSYQSTNPNEWNLWYQFIAIQRSGYIGAGARLVNILRADSAVDPRLEEYYSTNSVNKFVGAPPTGGPGDYSNLSGTRLAQNFNQPMVTFAENELIIAEAELHAGSQALAIQAYNAERASQGALPWAGGLITLNDIITEKYIADFQQIEVYNDWKRTCLPLLVAANSNGIPGRVFYPLSAERNANKNIPPPSSQPLRNWDQPNACPTNLGG
ncbi:MAG TPA: SusD/RagB family nutrient-binding outer membrane lipoprotein [Gemmatimonadaceae bacterium]|nr:SusD/RagB family nutrient-binding outer membrane lipoprotein [Gemmatimonadaceae bacterium]